MPYKVKHIGQSIFKIHDSYLGSLTLITEILDNGDARHGLPVKVILDQMLVSRCENHCVSMSVENFTPEKLREMADQLEQDIEKAKILIGIS